MKGVKLSQEFRTSEIFVEITSWNSSGK